MSNHPDEQHTLRDRVDEAISWFTGTDEAEGERAAEAAPVATEAPNPVGQSAEESVVDEPVAAPMDEPVAAPVDEPVAAPVDEPVAAPVDEPVAAPADEPVAGPADEPVVTPADEPVAARAYEPGAPAVAEPVSTSAESTTPEPRPAPEPETAAWPVAVDEVARRSTSEPVAARDEFPSERPPARADLTDVEPEVAVPAAVDGAPSEEAAAGAPYLPAAESFAATSSNWQSSAADEPTRVHPREEPAPVAEPGPAATTDEQLSEEDQEEPLAADAAETTASQRLLFRDEAPTTTLPVGAEVPPVERTAVMDPQEAARLRREERAARDRQLGKVIASDDEEDLIPPTVPLPSTYKALPSLGLLLFRLVIAAVVGIRGYQHITRLTATREMWAATIVPSPNIVAWVQIGVEFAIVIMLVIGLGNRIAGLLLLLLAVAQLAFVQWGAVNPFQPGASDFIGVVDVLLAAAGLLFMTIGGGRAAFDGAIHTGRVKRKNSRLFA